MSDLAEQLLKEEEGNSPTVYPDSLGIQTIGVGCVVDKRMPGAGLCDDAIEVQLAHDSQLARRRAAALTGFDRCSDVRQAVLISMCFQLGDLRGWPHFRAALATGDYNVTADNMLYSDVSDHTQSDWDRQTSHRCEREAWMMRHNAWLPKGQPIPTGA